MFLLITSDEKFKRDVSLGQVLCPRCKGAQPHFLARTKRRVCLFFIPIISITRRRYLVCEMCSARRELTKQAYKGLKEKTAG